jgi:hypothetical protein
MSDSTDHTDLKATLEELRDDPDALIAIILAQAERIDRMQSQIDAMQSAMNRLRERVRELNAENRRLRQERDDAEQAGNRQAAPFRREDEKRSSDPSPPGRKEGHEASYRPEPERIDARVEVEMAGCPECGDAVTDVRPIRQVVEEILPIRPQVIKVTTYRGDCPECGTIETTHPLKTTSATGAAGTHLGPRAQALALTLRERHGLTMRRVREVLRDGYGLDLSPGGLAQMEQRCAKRLKGEEERLLEAARTADVQHVDETSWWVAHPEEGAKPLQWLWVFADEEQTLYRVDPRRRRKVVQEVLGGDFPGVLVSDCLNIYDEATPVQHKCYAHHLKAISRAQRDCEAQTGEPSTYLSALRALLKGAQGLKKARGEMAPEAFENRRAALEASADRLLTPGRADSRTEGDGLSPIEDKIRRRLKKQRDHLFTFLDHETVPATNNRAERRLRPAVIRRKLSAGNRTPSGARAFERIASVAETCVQQGRSVVEYLRATMSLGMEPLPLR